MDTSASTARSKLRTVIEGGVCLLIVLLISQTWLIDGVIAPCRINSGSMAVGLLGPHRDVVCANCGFAFSCDSAVRPVSARAVCPNCGYAENDLGSLPDVDGDMVLIDRSAFLFRRPRRWEIAAFRYAREAEKILIKRIVGLPGESVQILNGDVYVNGNIQRKTLDLQRSMSIPVYCAKYSPAIPPIPPPQWQGENDNSLWKSDAGSFIYPKAAIESQENNIPEQRQKHRAQVPGLNIDWLVYSRQRSVPGNPGVFQRGPITDIMAYNQTLPRREEDVHAMNDLMLRFRLASISGPGKFFIRAIAGQDVFQVEIDANTGDIRVNRNDNQVWSEHKRIVFGNKGVDVVISLIDRQFLMALNDRTVFSLPMDAAALQTEPTPQPFALGTQGLGVVVADLCIYRDVYYTHPIGLRDGTSPETPIRLGENEYYVLGDNSSIAEDSRNWFNHSPVVDNLLIGKPLSIVYPAKSVRIGSWQFQVPDISRIGYIQ